MDGWMGGCEGLTGAAEALSVSGAVVGELCEAPDIDLILQSVVTKPAWQRFNKGGPLS